ncbi:MAG: diguanylate cyclase [Azonexus sp.]|nr:diguanylate cyclase [Azonexus sp.]
MTKPKQVITSQSAGSVFRILDAAGRGQVTKADIKALTGFDRFFESLDSSQAGKLDEVQFRKAWRQYRLAPEIDDRQRLANELILRQKEIAILKKRLRQANAAPPRGASTAPRAAKTTPARQAPPTEPARRERLLRRQVEAEKSRLEGVLESVSDVVVDVSSSGRITYLNRLAPQRVKRTKDEFIGRELTAIFPGEVGQMVQESLSRAARGHAPVRFEYFSKVHSCWFETRVFPTDDGAVIISADISRRKQVERRLREALDRFRTASEMAMLGFWEWQPAKGAVYFSPEWKKQLGYADAELPNRIEEWKRRLHPDDRKHVLQQVARAVRQPAADFEMEYRLAHKDGGYRWISARWMALPEDGNGGPSFAVTHLDVTSVKEEAAHLDYVASHDSLTGLPNRSLVHEFAEHVMSSARRQHGKVAVLFLDLDRFKAVNDTYGHKAGDRVLQEAAQRIAHSLRAEDLVGRLGGDEFVAVLSEISGFKDVTRAATECLETLSQPFALGKRKVKVLPSIGISIFPDDGDSIETLIHNADIAMYEAKRSGGGKFCLFARDGATHT